MIRVRTLTVLTAGALLVGACGSSSPTKPATDTTTSTTAVKTTTTMDPEMDHGHEGGAHDEVEGKAKPLALLPDGTVDPDKIDLSGVPGVTAEQQAKAEALVRESVLKLPKWTKYDDAISDGFKSIGDGLTGEEHVIKYEWIEDDVILDPTQPESLVYKVERADDGTVTKTLEAAMFLLPSKYTLDNPPEVGGKLMQYHIHNNLCFTQEDAPKVRGITNNEGKCSGDLVKGNENSMIHVWIRANKCGPFSALEGFGAGQIKEGEEVNCDAAHGHHG
jgi:hypothetical protein